MKHSPHDISDPELFINRELSWINFNSRVLDEAAVPANPLLEPSSLVVPVLLPEMQRFTVSQLRMRLNLL